MIYIFFFVLLVIFLGQCYRTDIQSEKDWGKIYDERLKGQQAIDDLFAIVSVPVIGLCIFIFIGNLF